MFDSIGFLLGAAWFLVAYARFVVRVGFMGSMVKHSKAVFKIGWALYGGIFSEIYMKIGEFLEIIKNGRVNLLDFWVWIFQKN